MDDAVLVRMGECRRNRRDGGHDLTRTQPPAPGQEGRQAAPGQQLEHQGHPGRPAAPRLVHHFDQADQVRMVELAEQRRLPGLALRIPRHQDLDGDGCTAAAGHGAPDLARPAPAEQDLERVTRDDGWLAGRRFLERQRSGHVGDRRTIGRVPVRVVHSPVLAAATRSIPGASGCDVRDSWAPCALRGRPITGARRGRPGQTERLPSVGRCTRSRTDSVPASPICGRDRARYLHLVAAARATSLQPSTEQQIVDIVRVTVDDEVDTGTFAAIVADVTTAVLR